MAGTDPLDGSRLRHERAREHLTHIRTEIERLYGRFAKVAAGENPQTRRFTIEFPELEQPPPTLSLRVGETIYNLRAALDYAVFELARHDSGREQEGTQFPIEDREQVFRQKRRRTCLKGVSDEHIALIETYQPYNGCDWTGTLRALSNPDKHRQLHLLLTQLDDKIEITGGHLFSAEDLHLFEATGPHGETRRRELAIGRSRHMRVNLELTASVTFADGLPVVETLEQLETQTEILVELLRRAMS